MRIVVAISGASGVELGIKFVEYLPKDTIPYVITTANAKVVARLEQKRVLEYRDNSNIGADIASGSFGMDMMAVIPCSMNTLAKVANGIADNLVTRVAAVAIKERKKLLLAPREMPFSPIALENMYKLSMLGITIAPPILGYYSDIKSIDDMERFIIGRWYDFLGIENTLYKRWK